MFQWLTLVFKKWLGHFSAYILLIKVSNATKSFICTEYLYALRNLLNLSHCLGPDLVTRLGYFEVLLNMELFLKSIRSIVII